MLRRGTSLVEVVVALTLGAVLLSAALGSLLRQQRTTVGLVASGQGSAQLRAAVLLLPAQLGLSSPRAGDFVHGELSDTSMQLRAPVASGVSCDGAATITMDPDEAGAGGAGVASLPRAGDSLWWYRPDSAVWAARPILAAWTGSAPCPALGDAAAVRAVIRLSLDEGGEPVPARAALRVTRQVRLSIYRSGDGSWQLGLREWSDATHSLSAPQPVAGPFQRVAPDGSRSGFRYLDSLGAEIPLAAAAGLAERLARVRFTGIMPASAGSGRDSTDVVIRPGGT